MEIIDKELWTSKQRQMHSLHYAISYRGAFKPEIPEYFINMYLYNKKNKIILDPFGGRGTTTLQANLMGHSAIYNDVNKLPAFYAKTRSNHKSNISDYYLLINNIYNKYDYTAEAVPSEYRPFFHKKTWAEINHLFSCIPATGSSDSYLLFTLLSRLHGHSKGYLSAYTFPQFSVSAGAQKKINEKYGKPEYRNVAQILTKKIKADFKDPFPDAYEPARKGNLFYNLAIPSLLKMNYAQLDGAVDLVVTSPPFLNVINYASDNWLKSSLMDFENESTGCYNITNWVLLMNDFLILCARALKKNCVAVVEVGEVKTPSGIVSLEQVILELCEIPRNLKPETLFINRQKFTKLANTFGGKNNIAGTNTNRCLVFRKR